MANSTEVTYTPIRANDPDLLKDAMEALDDYLNAGHKEARKAAAEKAKAIYKEYYGEEYKNRDDRESGSAKFLEPKDSINIYFEQVMGGGINISTPSKNLKSLMLRQRSCRCNNDILLHTSEIPVFVGILLRIYNDLNT